MNPLVIRADSTMRIGIGHVMRCIALGQAWQDNGGKVVFISHCKSAALEKRLVNEDFDFISLDKPHSDSFDLEYTLNTLHKLSVQNKAPIPWLVVDGYHFDADYQKNIKEAGYNLLWIDDYGHAEHYWADIILNQNITAKNVFYQNREPYTRLLLGSKYVLLRKEFLLWKGWLRKIAPVAKKILVTMGGADSNNVTLKVINAIQQIDQADLEIRVVVGPNNPYFEILQKATQSSDKNIHILRDVKDMPELMAWADIAIAAGGSTCWELAFMGLPSLLVILADNQIDIVTQLSKDYVAINLGYHEKIKTDYLSNKIEIFLNEYDTRLLLSKNGELLIDGLGSSRICNIISTSDIILRPVIEEDCERVWEWANDPSVRAMSFSKSYIDLEEHVRWFKNRIDSLFFYIALSSDGIPLGQVRVDRINNEAIISMMVDKDFRNRGYGEKLIKNACAKVFQSSEFNEIIAYIETDNKASLKTFIKAGFKETENTNNKNKMAKCLILSKTDCGY